MGKARPASEFAGCEWKTRRDTFLWQRRVRWACQRCDRELVRGGSPGLVAGLQALGKDIVKVVVAGVLVDFLFHVAIDVFLPTPVTAGQGLAVSRTRALDKAGIEVANGFDGARPALVPDLGRALRILPVEVAQEDWAAKESATDGLARMATCG
jgi:hypothetical protein